MNAQGATENLKQSKTFVIPDQQYVVIVFLVTFVLVNADIIEYHIARRQNIIATLFRVLTVKSFMNYRPLASVRISTSVPRDYTVSTSKY